MSNNLPYHMLIITLHTLRNEPDAFTRSKNESEQKHSPLSIDGTFSCPIIFKLLECTKLAPSLTIIDECSLNKQPHPSKWNTLIQSPQLSPLFSVLTNICDKNKAWKSVCFLITMAFSTITGTS